MDTKALVWWTVVCMSAVVYRKCTYLPLPAEERLFRQINVTPTPGTPIIIVCYYYFCEDGIMGKLNLWISLLE